MNSRFSSIVAVASFLLFGCTGSLVPETQSDGSSRGRTESTGTGVPDTSGDSSGSPSGVTSVSETTTGSTLGTSSAADSSSSSGGTGASACKPEGSLRTASVEFGVNVPKGGAWETVDATCFVGGFERGGGTSEYALECDEGEPEPTQRSLRAPFIPALDVGMTVRLRFLSEQVTDGRYYEAFAIHDLSGVLLMGNYRNNIPSNAPIDPTTFFAPLEFEPVDAGCPVEPPAEDDGRDFISNPCPLARTSLAVTVTSGEQSSSIVDETARSVGGYEFNVFASFLDFVDPDTECGSDRETVSVYVFSEQQ